jgi:carbamoyl-phosphate synthase large subunit
MGGQTALNTALSLRKRGVLEKYDIELIGASADAIDKAEDRELFRQAMMKIGLDVPRGVTLKGYLRHKKDETGNFSMTARTIRSWSCRRKRSRMRCRRWTKWDCPPSSARPSRWAARAAASPTTARNFRDRRTGLDASPTNEVLIEESVLGWKEFEMEVVRDRADNAIIVCSIENVDPMGVHTGDSITVAPALTLTDKEYQRMRSASIAVLREIGVETGGSNVQFAVNPADGRMVIIEMNPRVSRSSALASKATGFPIAKIAAKLAVGYTLDELQNDITEVTPAAFEPTIDYVVTKIPRFAFEKFPGAEPVLTTSMKSVGEAMAIGRTFAESLQKALRSLETGLTGLDESICRPIPMRSARRWRAPARPFARRGAGDAPGLSDGRRRRITKYDPWFLGEIETILKAEASAIIARRGLPADAEGLAPPQGHGLFRRAARQADGATRKTCARARARRAARLQAHRHLRRGIRRAHALHVFDL